MRQESVPSSPSVPATVVIEATKAWLPINLRDIWTYRELLYFLTWRDLKIRYKQTVLGVAWVVLQPLLMTLIFTVFLGKLVRVPSAGIPYPLLAYSGLAVWTFFSSAVIQGGSSLVANTTLITKTYFPRAIIPAATVCARAVDFCVTLLILFGMMAYYGINPGVRLMMLPVCLLLTISLALAFALLTSALNVRYRDVSIILPVAMQLWMFVSPVVYPASLVPQQWLWLYRLNPVTGILEAFRSCLLNRPFDWAAIAMAAGTTVVPLVYALFAFKRMERHFADII